MHVWRRRTGEYAQLFHESTMIFEIKAGEPDKVVTSLVNGVVKVYRVGEGCQLEVAHDIHTVGQFDIKTLTQIELLSWAWEVFGKVTCCT